MDGKSINQTINYVHVHCLNLNYIYIHVDSVHCLNIHVCLILFQHTQYSRVQMIESLKKSDTTVSAKNIMY